MSPRPVRKSTRARPSTTKARRTRTAAAPPEPCRHPITRRLGPSCGVCGEPVGKR